MLREVLVSRSSRAKRLDRPDQIMKNNHTQNKYGMAFHNEKKRKKLCYSRTVRASFFASLSYKPSSYKRKKDSAQTGDSLGTQHFAREGKEGSCLDRLPFKV